MKKILVLLITLIITVLPSNAEIEKISADGAVRLALQHNLALQAKRKEIEVLLQEVKMANALKNPQIQSTVLMGPIGRSNASQAGLAVPVEIAKRGVRKKAAIANMKLLENQIRQEELNLKLEVMSAYFDVVYMKSVVAILQEREELFKNIWSEIKEVNKLLPPYKYIKHMILTNKPLIKTTTQKVKRNEELKEILKLK